MRRSCRPSPSPPSHSRSVTENSSQESSKKVTNDGIIAINNSQSQVDLTPRPWSPKPRTLTTAPTSHKRKRDVAWSAQRITETNMQKILHKFTHTSTKDTKSSTPSGQVDITGGESSEGECVGGGTGSWDGEGGQGRSRRLVNVCRVCSI